MEKHRDRQIDKHRDRETKEETFGPTNRYKRDIQIAK